MVIESHTNYNITIAIQVGIGYGPVDITFPLCPFLLIPQVCYGDYGPVNMRAR